MDEKTKDDFDSTSFFCGSIITLFMDFLTNDITENEWRRLHDDLSTIILKIKKSG